MHRKSTFTKDLFMVAFSNFIILISSIITGFVVPKILGVVGYGYYKIFTLYLSYSALMHLGYVDGVLLTFAGKEYNELSQEKFRMYTKFFFFFQCVVSVLIVFIAMVLLKDRYKLIFLFLGIDIFAINMTAYYQYISQSTMRFDELSIRKVMFATFEIMLVLAIVWFNFVNKRKFIDVNIYVGGLVFIDVVLMIWYVFTYRKLSIGECDSFSNCKDDIKSFFKEGIILTIAYQAASIVFSLDSQFVSVFYDATTFAVYSFAYSLISMVTTVISAVAFVLLPRLRKINDKEKIMNTFSNAMALISITATLSMAGYQPLCILISSFFSEYIDSIRYLRVIIPGLALSCCINIIMFTYYKAINKHMIYFKISLVSLTIAILCNYLAYKFYHDAIYISFASIITLIIWYIMNVIYFVIKYQINWKKNFIYIILSMTVYYILTWYIKNELLSWILFIFYFIISTGVMHAGIMREILMKFIKGKYL